MLFKYCILKNIFMNLYFFFISNNVKILVKKYVWFFLVLFEIICIMINVILKELFSFDNKMIIIFYKLLFEDI